MNSKAAANTHGKVSVDRCTDRASQTGCPRRNVVEVDNRSEVREFLTSRRAKVTPQHAGLPETFHRRVPGLRRSEVAALAGMSVEYYAKLERGSLGGVSAGVLDAIARALQLDEAERAHLFHSSGAALPEWSWGSAAGSHTCHGTDWPAQWYPQSRTHPLNCATEVCAGS